MGISTQCCKYYPRGYKLMENFIGVFNLSRKFVVNLLFISANRVQFCVKLNIHLDIAATSRRNSVGVLLS